MAYFLLSRGQIMPKVEIIYYTVTYFQCTLLALEIWAKIIILHDECMWAVDAESTLRLRATVKSKQIKNKWN